jgi:hypothetical protein
MAQRAVSKSDREWWNAICEYGCIVCWNVFGIFTPCCPHHTDGRTKEGCHKKTIGLCGKHHQTGGEGTAFHATGKKTWQAKFGTQEELLLQLQNALNGLN